MRRVQGMYPVHVPAGTGYRGTQTRGVYPCTPDTRCTAVPPMSEDDLLAGVLDLFRLYGWRTFHVRPGRVAHGWRTAVSGDGVGWPDLFAIGPKPSTSTRSRRSRLIAAELKVGRNRPTEAQTAWLEALAAAGVDVFCWTPADYPDGIAAELAR